MEEKNETLMSRDDFMPRVEQVAQGMLKSFASVEELDKYVWAL